MWHKFPHLYVKTITTINFPLPPTPTKAICLGSTILNSCVDYMYLFCSSSNVLLLLLYHAIVSDRRRRIFQLPTFSLCNSGAITKKKKEKSVFGTHLKADCVCDSSICRISSAPSSANNIRYQLATAIVHSTTNWHPENSCPARFSLLWPHWMNDGRDGKTVKNWKPFLYSPLVRISPLHPQLDNNGQRNRSPQLQSK